MEKRFPVRVLVFPGGTEIGLEIFRSLAYSAHVELFGATSLQVDSGVTFFKKYFRGLPFVTDPNFVSVFIELLEKESIDFVFPAHDTVGLVLSEIRDQLPCDVLISPFETCVICRNKRETYTFFYGILPVPKMYDDVMSIDSYPVFVKPAVGEGSRGTCLAQTREELIGFKATKNDYLYLEYLPGEEYTVDCFTDREGNLRFVGARERVHVDRGISTYTRIVDKTEFEGYAKLINSRLCLRGAWFFQMKRNRQGKLVLLEIAPRVSGGMGVFRNRGVNLPLLTLYDAMNLPVRIYEQDCVNAMHRALANYPRREGGQSNGESLTFTEVYVDFDDTILIREKLNPLIVVFLVQCKNQSIPVYLLTRHKGDVRVKLEQWGLLSFFRDVLFIDEFVRKSTRITGERPILIDDSFSEREEVYCTLGIPTFGVEMLEGLIDWRM